MKNNLHEDPYAHLHTEDYHDAFNAPLLNHQNLFFRRNRAAQSLNGAWFLTLDNFDEGLRQKWFLEPDICAKDWILPPDFSVEGGKKVQVPLCMNLVDPTWDLYAGAMWFTRDFDFVPNPNERIFLRIGAAANEARVFLNGEFLGRHLGASTPFNVELSNIKNGKNRLQIQVDNKPRAESVPMNHTDWFNYGGIYRDIEIITLPSVFIRDFYCGLVANGKLDTFFAEVALSEEESANNNQFANFAIPALNINETIEIKNGKGRIEVAFDKNAKPELWSDVNPSLYNVCVTFGADQINDKIGFREIAVKGEKIFLNGKEIFLRGICVHEEYPNLGKAANEGEIRQMLAHVKELNANFIRLSHYPHHEKVAELADELGILLWEEIPVYWAIDFSRKETLEDATNQLSELILRDKNRASVIIWGVGNENADTDARLNFMSLLAKTAKNLDPTRLTSAACLINRETFKIEDRLAAHLDIIGINEYFGWYEPNLENLSLLLKNSDPKKPVIITETGADALLGKRGGKRELFTEDCQMNVYEEQLKRLSQAPYICGICPWILYDFRTQRRQNHFQQGYNLKGLIDKDHQRKKGAFFLLADFYLAKIKGVKND